MSTVKPLDPDADADFCVSLSLGLDADADFCGSSSLGSGADADRDFTWVPLGLMSVLVISSNSRKAYDFKHNSYSAALYSRQ